jgi:multiple sugar transport system ATP-binding protein
LRPEDITIQGEKEKMNAIPAEIYVTEPLGNETIVDVTLGDNVIKVLTEPDFEGQAGQRIWITINSAKLHLFHEETHECIYHASSQDKIDIL